MSRQLFICLLGRFEVQLAGSAVIDRAWPRRKAQALLKLLALQPARSLHREQVFDRLWPDRTPEAAGNNLRQSLGHLRAQLAANGVASKLVSVSADMLILSPDARLDIADFRSLAQGAFGGSAPEPFEQALAVYAGDLLPDDLYEEWTSPDREQLRDLRCRLLLELGRVYEASAHVELAVERFQELLRIDPAREEAHQGLMRIYAGTGRRQQALRQYETLRERLQSELIVEPSIETKELYRSIVEMRSGGVLAPAPAEPTVPEGELPPMRSSRPAAGTLTVLFTDLVGSTDLMQRLGDEAAERVRRSHFRALRDAVATRGGQEVKSLGDGLMVVFPSTIDALACAVAMQQAVDAQNQRGQEPRLDVRVGLDVGEPIPHEGDYHGMPVVVAGRLCDRARGGQIVVSELVWRLAASRGDYTFRDLGALRLKGINQPVTAYEVDWRLAAARATAQQAPTREPSLGLLPAPLLAASEGTSFVGRSRELQALRNCWTRTCAGHRQLLLLAGEPGIGKTRLAAEFARQVCAEGTVALVGRVESESALAYQPFISALMRCAPEQLTNELRVQLGTAGAERALQALALSSETYAAGERGDESKQDTDRRQLFQSLAALFTETQLAKPTILLLDDLHQADGPTIELLAHIMRRPQRSPLLIVGTYRETDLSPTHPLVQAIADLRRERLVERLFVTGLDEPEVGALVASWAGQDSPEALTRMIHGRSEGNPFFVEELLRHLTETGAMYDEQGRLRDDLIPGGVPQVVKEIINGRLARLSERCNSVLTIASVIGREFGIDSLARASGLSEDQLLDALEEAVRASVVNEAPHAVGRYSFTHSLTHETLYDELTTTRRVHLHGQTLQYADNDGVKLAYEVLGADGPHIIAVGLSSCPAVRVRTRNRTTVMRWERLTARFRLILYDRRGVGFSSAPERGYSLFVGVEDLRAVLDAAGVERAILWGAVDGGPLALAFAAHHPERVAGLLLMGTTAKCASSDDFPFGIPAATLESYVRTAAVDRRRALSQLFQARASGPADLGDPGIADAFATVPRQVWNKVMGSIGAADARSLLPQVRAPTLIVHDPDNSYIPVGAAHYLHEHIPGSQLMITKAYGPLLLGESVYARVEAFIEEVICPNAS